MVSLEGHYPEEESRPVDIVDWAEEHFYIPETKAPIRLLEHQKRILRDVFTPGPDGRFPYQTIIYSAPKKSGKSAIAALITLWFALTQEPMNEIYVVANDFEQAQGRVYAAVRRAIEMNPELRDDCRLLNKTITIKSTGTVITALASDYAGAAGSNHGLTSWSELWAYTRENARRLWDELTPVPTRRNSLRFIDTYAGFEEESELLWELYQQGLAGKRLYEDLPVYVNGRLYMYWDTEPRMPWQTKEYYEDQRSTLRPNAFTRLHGNTWTKSEERFIDMADWDACVDPEHRPALPRSLPAEISVGVDIGIKHDSAAVVGVYYDAQAGEVVQAFHRIWQPTPTDPLDLEDTIEDYLREANRNYRLERIRYDPYQFISSAQRLSKEGLLMEEFPQTSGNLTAMGQNLWELITGKNMRLYRSEEVRGQAKQAVAVESTRGWKIDKAKARHKIDVIIALAMAALAAVKPGQSEGPRPLPSVAMVGGRRRGGRERGTLEL